jgi:DNA modification methylase
MVEIKDARFCVGDCRELLKTLPDRSVQVCVTSPPYFGLRDYGVDGQIGLEPTPDEYIAKLVAVFREVRRVLRDDGTLWLNIGDSYAGAGAIGRNDAGKDIGGRGGNKLGSGNPGAQGARPRVEGLKTKDLIGIPWLLAFALRADGWYLRQDIIWHKPNPMPESVRDRCTKAHEYLFLLSKSERYYFDQDAIAEPSSAESIARYGRGRSNTHKWADGGPGGQTIARSREHIRERTVGVGSNARPSKAVPNEAVDVKRNRRSVWTISTKPFKGAHFATFPPDLVEPCILAGSRPGDTVLDPFGGVGTTALVALRNDRKAISMELNPDYVKLAIDRIRMDERANQTRLIA